MRTALLIADGKVILGPCSAETVEHAFKDAVRAGGKGHSRVEVWTEDRGMARYAKFSPAPTSANEAPAAPTRKKKL